jgi:hypothetical protein
VSFRIKTHEDEFISTVKAAIKSGDIIRTQITPDNLKQVFDKWVAMVGREIVGVSEEDYALLFFADIMHDGTVSTHANLPAELMHKNGDTAPVNFTPLLGVAGPIPRTVLQNRHRASRSRSRGLWRFAKLGCRLPTPSSTTCELPGKSCCKNGTSLRDRFSSSNNFIAPPGCKPCAHGLRRKPAQPKCLPFATRESLRVFQSPAYHWTTWTGRHRPKSAAHGYKAVRRVVRGSK